MNMRRALRVERGDVVSFVGGGGKTSSMFRLASELTGAGLRVLTTTTTHISLEQTRFAPTSIRPEELSLLGERLDRHGQCLLTGLPDGKGRVFGVPRELIASLHPRPDLDVILVEADGSRSRPFKAPGNHEPVVPDVTTILVPIAGMNTIGEILDEDHTHRSEIISVLAEQEVGSRITAETVARVLSHREGGARQLPPGARLVPLLNKADAETGLLNARETARLLLASPIVDSVVISSMLRDPPVLEVHAPVAGIVLAAGQATRYGSTKQLAAWGDTTLAAHCVRVALDAGLDPVIAVIGHDADRVGKALSGLPVRMVYNPDFAEGQSASVRKGLEFLPARAAAAVFLLADQPFVTAGTVNRIIEAHRRTLAPACVPVFEGRRGNPVLFDRTLFPELREMHGDTGGRTLLEKYRDRVVTVPAPREVTIDIDTPEDFTDHTDPCNL